MSVHNLSRLDSLAQEIEALHSSDRKQHAFTPEKPREGLGGVLDHLFGVRAHVAPAVRKGPPPGTNSEHELLVCERGFCLQQREGHRSYATCAQVIAQLRKEHEISRREELSSPQRIHAAVDALAAELDARPPLTTEADGARRLVALLGPSLHLTVAHAIGHNSGAIGRLRAHRQTQAATRRRKESHHRNFRKPSMGTAVRAMVFAQKLRRRASSAASSTAAATGIAAVAAAAAAAGAGAGALEIETPADAAAAAPLLVGAPSARSIEAAFQPLPHAGFTHEGGAGGVGKENQDAWCAERPPARCAAAAAGQTRAPAHTHLTTCGLLTPPSLSPPPSGLCAALAPTSKCSPCSTATGKPTAARRRARRRRRSRRT